MKKLSIAIAALVLILCASCATAPNSAVTLELDGQKLPFETIEEAVAAIPAGAEGTVIVNSDVTVTTAMTISDKTVNLTNGKNPVVITDVTGNEDVKTNSIFTIDGTGKVTVKGTAAGYLTLQGTGMDCIYKNRTMFNVGPQEGDKSTAATLVVENVTIQNVYSTYTGAIMRGFGNVTFTDVICQDCQCTVNGMFMCLYGVGVINGGTFQNCEVGGNGGFIQVTNTDNVSLTVNGATFTGINGAQLGTVVNSYAKSKVVLNDCTVTGNTCWGAGGAIYCLGNWEINGGTFTDNKNLVPENPVYDVFVKAAVENVKINGATIGKSNI